MAKSADLKVRLEPEDERILADLAKRAGVNRSEMVRRALRAFAQREREDAAIEKLAAWARVDEARHARGKRPAKPKWRAE